jgi:signal transduction histidine kinase/ligand-binding sensor domain-containing protein
LSLKAVFPQQNLKSEIKFRTISSKNGLPSNSVQACLLDSYGFVWFGTQCGLARYDGINMKTFDVNNSDSASIGDGFIWSIIEDEEHYLWIGTNNGGLNRYDPKTEKFTRYKNNPSVHNSISNNTVYCVLEDDDKNLWLSTNLGINKFDRKTQIFTRFIHSDLDSNSISFNGRSTIFKDKNGNIFVGTRFGLNKYIKSKNHFQRIHLAENDSFEILCISQDETGLFWLGTQERGIFKYNETTGSIENIMPSQESSNTLASNAIRAIIHCDNGLIWFGHLTEKAGLDIYDRNTNTYYNFKHDKTDDKSVALNVMWDIYKDRYDNMWICTNGGGVSFYSEYTMKFNHIKKLWGNDYSRDLKVVWGVLYAYDRFWCYTEGTILSFSKYGEFIKEYNPALTKLRLFTPLHIGQTSGRMYVGDLDYGITYYDSTKDMFIKCPVKFLNPEKRFKIVDRICEDKEGNIWLGTRIGLVKLDKDFNELDLTYNTDSTKIQAFKKWSRSIFLDSKNYLWFGGDGISRMNIYTGEYFNYKPDDTSAYKPAGDIMANTFYEDGKGNMWISYEGSGFDRLNLQTNTFKHYNVSNGLITNYLLCLLPDKSGNLWFSSAKGIIKFNPETESYTNYNVSDGVQDNEFNTDCFSVTEDGMISFGGVNGINWFYPDKMKTNAHIPPVAVTFFKVFNEELNLPQSISLTNEIELSHKQNFFAVQFASLDYVNPSKNEYKYMLEGIDNDWIYSGNKNEANYTDIDAGEYTFRVKGSNNDGVWNEEGKSIKIIITPPWWQRWWFKGFLILLLAGFAYFGINNRYEKLKKEKIAQEVITRKIIESNEEERKKIAADLHDSVGQDLVILKNTANIAAKKSGNNSELIKFLNKISELSSSALNNIRNISHILRPVELDKLGLTETINSIIEMVSSSSEIKFTSDIDNIDNLFDKNDDVNFCRIIQESLNNILKHSKATMASVQIKLVRDEILTIIKDNGTGFNTEENGKGKSKFGLMGMKERVRMLNGILEINSAPGKGTELIIKTPLFKNL